MSEGWTWCETHRCPCLVAGQPRFAFSPIYDTFDCTAFIEGKADERLGTDCLKSLHDAVNKRLGIPEVKGLRARASFEGLACLHLDQARSLYGRSLACLVRDGAALSITLRVEKGDRATGEPDRGKVSVSEWDALKAGKGYKPDEAHDSRKPIPASSLVEVLASSTIWAGGGPENHGLLVVSGSTGSGKSLAARGLIYEYLKERATKRQPEERRPHLVTLEDPIETLLSEDAVSAAMLGVDFTPRHLGVDSPQLAAGLLDCRRQTPAAVYVGETRRRSDWAEVLQFAASGHLIVTTCHAGSLVETIGSLTAAVGASTPARRGELAQRILGVVHIRPLELLSGGKVYLPSVWTRTPSGVNSLVADGLAAVLPNDPRTATGTDARQSSVGRRWFARRLADRSKAQLTAKQRKEMLATALKWDLQGI